MKQILILLIFPLALISSETCKITKYLSIPDATLYKNWIDPQDDEFNGTFCLDIRTESDVLILLAAEPITYVPYGRNVEFHIDFINYSEIVITSDNTRVVNTAAIAPNLLDEDIFVGYCITWEFGLYSIYRGKELLAKYKRKTNLFPVKLIGLSTWRNDAVFKFDRKC